MTRSRHITWPTKQRELDEVGDRQGEIPRRDRGHRRKANPETGVQAAVRDFLRLHPAVAWVERINTGAAMIRGQYVAFGFKGCADIIGQMKARYGGAFLAVEVKGPRKYPSKDQREFLGGVRAAGGFAAWGRSVTDIEKALAIWVQARLVSHPRPAVLEVTGARHITRVLTPP